MMKHVGYILVAAGAALASPLAAQSGGIQGGLSLAELIGADVEEADRRTGLTGGGSFTLLRLGPLAIGPEIYYAQKGAEEARLRVESPEFFEQFGLNYLEVPVIAKLGFGIPGADWLGVYAQGGPAFAWNLDCNIEPGEDGAVTLNEECAYADPENQNAQTVIDGAEQGLVLGGGLVFRVMNMGSITLDGRLVRGLSRITEGAIEPDVKNQAVSLMIGYSFGGFGGAPERGLSW